MTIAHRIAAGLARRLTAALSRAERLAYVDDTTTFPGEHMTSELRLEAKERVSVLGHEVIFVEVARINRTQRIQYGVCDHCGLAAEYNEKTKKIYGPATGTRCAKKGAVKR